MRRIYTLRIQKAFDLSENRKNAVEIEYNRVIELKTGFVDLIPDNKKGRLFL